MASSAGAESKLRSAAPGLRRLLRAERPTILLSVALSVPSGFLEASVLALVAATATAISAGDPTVSTGAAGLSATLGVGEAIRWAAVLAVLLVVLRTVTSILPPRIVANTQARLRGQLFDAFVHTSWELQSKERQGHLQEVMTTQVGHTSQLLLALSRGMGASLTATGLLVSAFLISPPAAAAMAVGGVVLFFVFRPFGRHSRTYSRTHAAASLGFAEAVNETVQLGEEYHVFGVHDAQAEVVHARIESVRGPFFRAQAALGMVSSIYGGAVILMLVGGLAFLQLFATSQLAAIGAVVLILLRALSAGQQLQSTYTQVQNTTPYLERALDALETYREHRVKDGGVALTSIQTLQLEGASYAYGEGDALTDVDLEIRAGRAVGIVGPSGAGKSTLVQLLLRLREPSTGRMLVNGIDARDFAHEDWARLVAFVPQEPKLLQATVAENVRFHRPGIQQADLDEAARMAHVDAEIASWDDGWDRPIGQRADAVSGGQRQRLCLARALVTKPSILVLDEPTSALDPESERLVQATLAELRDRGVAVVVIAHRPSTLAFVDDVVIVDDGRVVASGPLAEITATGSASARRILQELQDQAADLGQAG